ncbi:MAG TPA: CBS domain-containing protein [Candidatus Binataceae bacterium]|nr:CBS domain-containing protein [Candidatus Binataceae bacterium]
MKIKQVMTSQVFACKLDDTLNRAAQLMWENECGCIPIISSDGTGAVVGMVTDRDICMASYTQGKPLFDIPVATAMAHTVISCHPDDEVGRVEALMRTNRVRRIPVLDERGQLKGIVSLDDLAREAEREKLVRTAPQITLSEVAETLAAVCEHRAPEKQAAFAG